MVRPIETEKPKGTTLEERLAFKFDDLQFAREDRDNELFDEISRSIEILLKGVPEAYDELLALKEELKKSLNEELHSIETEANQAADGILREYILNNKVFLAKWEFREIYEELIMEVLQKNELIVSITAKRSYLERGENQSSLEPVEEQPIEQQMQQEVPQQYQEPEQPQQQEQYVQQQQMQQPQEVPLPTRPPSMEQIKKLKKPYIHPKTKSFKEMTDKPEQNFEV